MEMKNESPGVAGKESGWQAYLNYAIVALIYICGISSIIFVFGIFFHI